MSKFLMKLVPPRGDKNWSIQVYGDIDENTRYRFRALRHDPKFKQARAFLQGDQPEWLMIEFWDTRGDNVLNCALRAEEIMGVSIGNGYFTPEEIDSLR